MSVVRLEAYRHKTVWIAMYMTSSMGGRRGERQGDASIMAGACDLGGRPLGFAPRSPRYERGNTHLSKNTLSQNWLRMNSNVNVPIIPKRKRIDIDQQPFDRSFFEVSKFRTRTLGHETSIPREEDGAMRFDDLINKICDNTFWPDNLCCVRGCSAMSSRKIRRGQSRLRTDHRALQPTSTPSVLLAVIQPNQRCLFVQLKEQTLP